MIVPVTHSHENLKNVCNLEYNIVSLTMADVPESKDIASNNNTLS